MVVAVVTEDGAAIVPALPDVKAHARHKIPPSIGHDAESRSKTRSQSCPAEIIGLFVGTTRGNVSHCISSLEAKGLLQRRIDSGDARAYELTLKPQGKKCALRVISAFDRLQKEFEEQVGKTVLSDTLKAIRKLEALFP